MSSLGPGTAIGERYVVLAPLGEGGMGEVVRARDSKLGREVAVKVLPAHAVGDATARARLLREARSVAQLEHPGIVHVYDVGETDDGGAFLVMELVRGESLRQRLEHGPLPLAAAVGAMIECARALAFADRAGAVHRDVKPDNVMIREDGRAVLLDFGIAKSVAIDAPTLTESGAIVGTPAYLAPEQARGEAVGASADQFALAVTTFELLTGRLPWSGTTSAALIASILRDEPLAPTSIVPELPEALDKVLARALRKDPDERYADLDAFADALEEVGKSAGVGSADLPASLARTEALPSAESHAPPTPPPPARRSRTPLWIALVLVALPAAALGLRAIQARARRAHSVAVSASASASAAPSVTTLLDLPPPPTKVPAAAAEYTAGMQALHDDNWSRASKRFKRATELDPGMAAAHFRLAMTAYEYGTGLQSGEYARAVTLRAQLSERDRALLDALEPMFERAQPDGAEAARRLKPLTRRWPRDVELYTWLAAVRFGDPSSLPAATRATELDPHDGDSWEVLGGALLVSGHIDQARAAFSRCVALSIESADCYQRLAYIDALQGRCGEYEVDARHFKDSTPVGDSYLLPAMASNARPLGVLHELVSQFAASLPREEHTHERLVLEGQLAVMSGDFVRGKELAKQEAKSMVGVGALSDSYGAHYDLAVKLVEIALETDDPNAARAAAKDFVARSVAWKRDPTDMLVSHGVDLFPYLARVAQGASPASSFEAQRRDWIDARVAGGAYKAIVWNYAYASPAQTPAEAREALAALARLGPVSPVGSLSAPIEDFGIPDAATGRVYLLAGEAAKAVPYLKRAVASCNAFTSPFVHTRAALDLGRALEQTGDKHGACDAYAKVLARWGHAKPRSVTAEAARSAAAKLGCKRP